MRFLATLVVVVGCSAAFLSSSGVAQDKKPAGKEVVLKGKLTCGKCDLGVDKVCATVIVVKGEKGKKDTVVYFDKASHGKYHDGVCTEAKNGSVEGVLKTEGKKSIISVKKLTYDK